MNVITSKEKHIGIIKLNRPETKNALDPATLIELDEAWKNFKDDDDVRVVVLASELDDSFCSGMDLASTIPIYTGVRPPETEAEHKIVENPMLMFEAMLRPGDYPKPIVCAINGYCLTGGWEMSMATDIRIASEDATFQMREAKYGIMPASGATVRLPRIIGEARAKWVLLSGEFFSAEQLLEWGFLHRVVPKEELLPAAMEMAEVIAANGPLSCQGIKRSINQSLGLSLDKALNFEMEVAMPIQMSDDAKEGPRAFREKRPPEFKGR